MYISPTVPFANDAELSIHFWKHGKKCGAATEAEYEEMAENFLYAVASFTTLQCVRSAGTRDTVRLDDADGRFGVVYGACTVRDIFRSES